MVEENNQVKIHSISQIRSITTKRTFTW